MPTHQKSSAQALTWRRALQAASPCGERATKGLVTDAVWKSERGVTGSWNVHRVLPVAGSSDTTVRRSPDVVSSMPSTYTLPCVAEQTTAT